MLLIDFTDFIKSLRNFRIEQFIFENKHTLTFVRRRGHIMQVHCVWMYMYSRPTWVGVSEQKCKSYICKCIPFKHKTNQNVIFPLSAWTWIMNLVTYTIPNTDRPLHARPTMGTWGCTVKRHRLMKIFNMGGGGSSSNYERSEQTERLSDAFMGSKGLAPCRPGCKGAAPFA